MNHPCWPEIHVSPRTYRPRRRGHAPPPPADRLGVGDVPLQRMDQQRRADASSGSGDARRGLDEQEDGDTIRN